MQVTGTMVYQNLEGGFWGIVGDDAQHYRPVEGLPAIAQKEGQRIQVEVEPVQSFSFAMWGRNVRVQNVKLL